MFSATDEIVRQNFGQIIVVLVVIRIGCLTRRKFFPENEILRELFGLGYRLNGTFALTENSCLLTNIRLDKKMTGMKNLYFLTFSELK